MRKVKQKCKFLLPLLRYTYNENEKEYSVNNWSFQQHDLSNYCI